MSVFGRDSEVRRLVPQGDNGLKIDIDKPLRSHPLFGQFLLRLIGLAKAAEAHSTQHVICLGELNTLILDDFEPVAPRIVVVQETFRGPL